MVQPTLSSSRFRKATFLLLILLGAFIALSFHQYGISNDEEVQHVYGRLLLDFYGSGFADQAAFHYKNLYLYGGFFDLIAAGMEKLLPFWVWDMRHLLSALFGFAGIVAAYKIARELGGERAGFIAVGLLCITGAWTGAMFTHTKDVPFATCMLWALYYTMRLAPSLPKPPLSLVMKLGIAVGCALGLRIGGVFAVLYLLMVVVLAAYLDAKQSQPGIGKLRPALAFLLTSAKHLIPAGLIAFLLMALFWPWAVMSPSHPLEAARAFSHFAFNMLTIVDGKVINIGDASGTYLIDYLLVRFPEVILLGLLSITLLGIANIRSLRPGRAALLSWAAVVIAAVFPLLFVLWDDPALYNGVRHFTFVIPPLTILSALGIHFTLAYLDARPKLQAAFGLLVIALAIMTAITLVRLHPYQYIYYNHFAGNTAQAENDWEADYWSSSIREAADILEDKVTGDKAGKPYLVAVCAESLQGSAYLDKRFKVTKNWPAADFYISTTNMNCDEVLQGEVIGKIERLDATLAVIKDRRKLTGAARLAHPAPQNDAPGN